MWGQLAVNVLQRLPEIIQFAEQLVPGSGKGSEKKLTVTSQMVQYEGPLALDQRVKIAKSSLIDAQVAYMNALDAAAQEAQSLGIILPQAGVDAVRASASKPSAMQAPPSKPLTPNEVTTSALDAVTRSGG